MNRVAFALALSLFAVSCQTAPTEPAEQACTLVYLKTGPKRDLSKEESAPILAAHFVNMNRLAREGHLLVAGPFGDKRSDPQLRGIFVLDAGTREAAVKLAETDPGFKAGVFVLEYHDFATAAPLRAFLTAELAERDQAEREGKKLEPGANIRGYVLLTSEPGALARAELAGNPAVLLIGRLDGSRTFAVLDAKDFDSARTVLGDTITRIGAYQFDEWYASRGLATLRALATKAKG